MVKRDADIEDDVGGTSGTPGHGGNLNNTSPTHTGS